MACARRFSGTNRYDCSNFKTTLNIDVAASGGTSGEAALANGKGGAGCCSREVWDLQKEIQRRDQVTDELTIASRIP